MLKLMRPHTHVCGAVYSVRAAGRPRGHRLHVMHTAVVSCSGHWTLDTGHSTAGARGRHILTQSACDTVPFLSSSVSQLVVH